MIATDTLLETLRVWPVGQHTRIVIEFQQQSVQATESIDNMPRDVAGVGQNTKTFAIVCLAQNKLQGFFGVMRHGDRQDFDITNAYRLPGQDAAIVRTNSDPSPHMFYKLRVELDN